MDRYVMDRGGVEALLDGSPKGATLLHAALSREATVHIALHWDAIPPTHPQMERLLAFRAIIDCQPHAVSAGAFPGWLIMDQRRMPFDPPIERNDTLYAIIAAKATKATILTSSNDRSIYLKNNIDHQVI